MNKIFSKLCTPAKIYFIIAVLSCIFAFLTGVKFMVVLIKLIFAFFWTFLLGWLCKNGYNYISWFLVLFPYIIIALAAVGIYEMTKEQKQYINYIQGYEKEGYTMMTKDLTKK